MERLIPFLLSLLGTVVDGVSPELREILESSIHSLEKRAKSTPNRFDDILVNMLKSLLGM